MNIKNNKNERVFFVSAVWMCFFFQRITFFSRKKKKLGRNYQTEMEKLFR